MRTPGGPSHRRNSSFRCEEATVTDVDRGRFTVTVETTYTNKTVPDIQVGSAYLHSDNGEGIYVLPEVGAKCHVCWPSDNSAPWILDFMGYGGMTRTTDGAPETPSTDAAGSPTGVSYRSRRPLMNPGDIMLRGRDENFVALRRGGILQIGASSIAQRIYIPLLNYIKDFAENYEMHCFGGDLAWTVGRNEDDPSGQAPASYVFHVQEFAQDAKATVRVKHMGLANPGGGNKSAWEVDIAPQGIDRDTGEVTGANYTLVVTTTGDKTEMVGASRTIRVKGDDALTVDGSRTATIHGNDQLSVDGSLKMISTGPAVLGGSVSKVGGDAASSPGVLGDQLVAFLGSMQLVVNPSTMIASLSPAAVLSLQQLLSTKVLLA